MPRLRVRAATKTSWTILVGWCHHIFKVTIEMRTVDGRRGNLPVINFIGNSRTKPFDTRKYLLLQIK
jgi:hypothetical protein